MIRAVVTAWIAVLTLLAGPALAQDFPERGTAPVVDAANILDPATKAALTEKLDAFEQRTQRQFVVATIPDLQGYDIADYGYQLGRHWALGDKGRNDGVILIVAPKDRKVRIEVGYGLEPILTDGYSALIVQNTILPKFKAGDMPGGIVAGADAIMKQLELPPDQAAEVAKQATQARASEGGGIDPGMIVWIVFILIFFILPLFRGNRGRRRYNGSLTGSTIGDIALWETGKAIGRGMSDHGGGWGGGGGGFGGSGGFSGGGGSFGGGGASGGW